jgi:hypothetical protein
MLAVLGILLIPELLTAMLGALRKPGDLGWPAHLAGAVRAAGQRLAQALFTLACLPYEAYFSLDAVLRTLWRLGVSRRGLLEWTSSGDLERKRQGLAAFYRSMWIAPALALLTGAGLALREPMALLVAAPILLAWLAAPLIAWWLSRPLVRREAHLSAEQTAFLHGNARKTWAFFETYVGAHDHWLPPDNVQEHPVAAVAHRTSPTNMGLALLANLAAYDFGYLPAGGAYRAHRRRAAHHGQAGAPPRPLLQLVRHPLAGAARAPIHLLGGQRQPRRSSVDPATGAAGADRRAHPASALAGGPRRYLAGTDGRPRGSPRVPAPAHPVARPQCAAADPGGRPPGAADQPRRRARLP